MRMRMRMHTFGTFRSELEGVARSRSALAAANQGQDCDRGCNLTTRARRRAERERESNFADRSDCGRRDLAALPVQLELVVGVVAVA